MINRFADTVLGNLQATLKQIDHAEFDAAAALMADPKRRIFATGAGSPARSPPISWRI